MRGREGSPSPHKGHFADSPLNFSSSEAALTGHFRSVGPVTGRGDRSPRASHSGRGDFTFGNRHRACTGTEPQTPQPEPRFAFSWALYRYKSPCTGSLPTSRHSGDSHRDLYSPCGIGRRSGLPWARLIPRVGMMTTTGPLGSAPTRQPTGGSQGHRQPSGGAFGTGGGTGSRQGDRLAS
uniref:Uncharacterized protein n=1 Tax=Ananas comosus var. bracteatus TaxID=296719 RepID=A0A6V7PHB0_ANACO|nr:unnamed protein product [Ananas comosus var. bracteatus]